MSAGRTFEQVMKRVGPVVGRLAFCLEKKQGIKSSEISRMAEDLRRAADDLEKLFTCQ